MLACVIGVAACTSGDPDLGSAASAVTASTPVDIDETDGSDERVAVEQVASSPVEDVPSALSAARGGIVDGLPEPEVPLIELMSGGPPPDGIPPIDAPTFLRAADVDFLADNEPVMAVEIDGDARAYPVQVLIWHEIVNDTVGGVPVAVTYCPDGGSGARRCGVFVASGVWSGVSLECPAARWVGFRTNRPSGQILSRCGS